ncbi:MAG TPA: hypothetical protein GX519_02185 [Thermoanaerobacterales bacterium]|nr:hypothetical protein [Thermoanaerobacterales bacterium]
MGHSVIATTIAFALGVLCSGLVNSIREIDRELKELKKEEQADNEAVIQNLRRRIAELEAEEYKKKSFQSIAKARKGFYKKNFVFTGVEKEKALAYTGTGRGNIFTGRYL